MARHQGTWAILQELEETLYIQLGNINVVPTLPEICIAARV